MNPKKFTPPPTSRNARSEAFRRLADQFANRECEEGEETDLTEALKDQPQITPKLKVIKGGVARAIEALRASDEDEALDFLDLYDSLSKSDQKLLKLEEISVAADVSTRRLFGLMSAALLEFENDVTKLLISTNTRAIVATSIAQAKTPKGLADREMMLKAAGVVAIPKGAQTIINASPTVNALVNGKGEGEDREGIYIEPGERLRAVHAAWDSGQKKLPSPAHVPAPSIIDAMQEKTVSVLAGKDH